MSGSSFRITTNGMFRNYRSNLTKNGIRLNDTMTNVQTQRKFNTYAEDPAAASNAWRMRRSYWRTNDQIDNNNHIISKYESAWTAMHSIVDGDSEHPGLDGILASIEGLSGTAGAGRAALGRELVATSENIVSVMNSKYGDDFIFNGADGEDIPFRWDGDKLRYRDIDVSLEKPEAPGKFGLTEALLSQYGLTSKGLGEQYDRTKQSAVEVSIERPMTLEQFRESSEFDPTSPDTPETQYAAYQTDYTGRNWVNGVSLAFADAQKIEKFQNYARDYKERNGVDYETGVENYEKLEKMAHETTYVDIGLGMKEDENGNFVTDSGFNSALSGLNFLGYGKDQNLAVAIRELGQIYANADEDTGEYANAGDKERADELLNIIHDTVRHAQGEHVQLDADAKYLRTNLDQLKTNKNELNEQIMETESMDPAEAITEMTWAQYCYNAALRIGTQILSQSLIDYMQ